ncbi:MAG TPA: hypothetical protein VFJ28_03285, partial [Marmoricola sp.]|nr:hypothetical protein [Marmoricola sp.]
MEERRRISAEHGVSRLGGLPTLAQIPIWLSLYHLLAEVASQPPTGRPLARQHRHDVRRDEGDHEHHHGHRDGPQRNRARRELLRGQRREER